MENICYHLLNMKKPYNKEDFSLKDEGSIYNCKTPTITEVIEVVDDMLVNYNGLEVFEENYGKQEKPFIKFRYNGLECEIYEHSNLCVRIKEIDG